MSQSESRFLSARLTTRGNNPVSRDWSGLCPWAALLEDRVLWVMGGGGGTLVRWGCGLGYLGGFPWCRAGAWSVLCVLHQYSQAPEGCEGGLAVTCHSTDRQGPFS